MKTPRNVAVFIVLVLVLIELAVLVLGDAGSECGDSCTFGQNAADTAMVLIYIEVGIALLVAVPLGLAYLIREGVRESKRTDD